MKRLLSILMILSSLLTDAQDFAPSGSIWHFKKYCPTPDFVNDCGYYTLEHDRDTMIQGRACKITTYKDNTVTNTNAQIIFHTDSSRVYFFETGSFKLLFDFTLTAGDTLIYSVPSVWSFYDLGCSSSPVVSKKAQAIVDSTTIVTISSQAIKVLYTSPVYNPDTSLYYSWFLGNIYERIGSTSGTCGISTTQCTAGYQGKFRCYSDALINYKPVPEACDFVTGVNNIGNTEISTLYPNPAHNLITLTLKKRTTGELFISNSLGQTILSRPLKEEIKVEIDISSLTQGLYFLQLEAGNYSISRKILKQ